mmetsp:Transcript_40914/g.61815  ORF Transcript_40914/g.61815 Transcript_40914/m.61815 type:complete len:90 (-) Transcript_40914:610-879(-)
MNAVELGFGGLSGASTSSLHDVRGFGMRREFGHAISWSLLGWCRALQQLKELDVFANDASVHVHREASRRLFYFGSKKVAHDDFGKDWT